MRKAPDKAAPAKQPTCCGTDVEVKEAVKDQFGAMARMDSTCGQAAQSVAESFGYTCEQLASVPAEANMGVSCGNPTAMSSLQPGEVVLDLGCGAGLDLLLAARKVGPTGKAIGIDMTTDMIDRARANAEQAGLNNVEIHLAEIESLPLDDSSVDCVISNCVLNLVPDKSVAFAEIFRVLKPGGRLAASDLALKQALPSDMAADIDGCFGAKWGAISIGQYNDALQAAGFGAVEIVDTAADLNAYVQMDTQSSCCSATSADADHYARFAEVLRKYDVNPYIASVNVFTTKPCSAGRMPHNRTVQEASDAEIKDAVRDRYAALSRSHVSSEDPVARQVAEAFGYSEEELASIPAEANLGVSCGNPTALASLKAGEVVVDLGSGGGLDVFLAAQQVGPSGKAIGIDMTEDMIQRARRNAKRANLTNVEFRLAEIESMPLPDDSVDCVISNCVLNLVPDKSKAFAEIFRVLKPRGRLAITDLALKKELPPELAADFSAYVGCVAGAMFIEGYESSLAAAGFNAVQIIDSRQDLNSYARLDEPSGCCEPSSCCGTSTDEPSVHEGLAQLLRKFDINEYVASVRVFALKTQ